jgi:PAS domain S-box-containing protein
VDTLKLKHILFSCLLLTFCQSASADIFWLFREADGSTNWQYVANFVGNILIIALAISSVRLYFTRRQARRYNNQLEDIRTQLEQRVIERTKTLDESNKLLKTEVSEHKKTTQQLQKSEAYINSILQSLPMILIGLNQKNQITQWNSRAEIISGVSFKQAQGMDLWKTFPAITVTPDQVKQAQDDNKIITVKYSQRGQYQFDITIYPLQREKETGVVILLDDVTQRAKNENMLIQRDKMSAMGEMAAVMAHDINTPLTAIIKDIKTVRQSVVDDNLDTEGLNELLEETIIRGQQASSVITNLLNFSASGGGEKTISSIVSVVNNSLDLASDVLSVTDNLRFSDVKVKTQYAEDISDVPCYVTELQQALLSILRYSCYALDNIEELDHKPLIRVDVSMAFDDLWLRIQHNGKGISLEEQKNLFEPFNQEDSENDGLDKAMHLSFCHFIIAEQHQGQIAVTCNENDGTTFHIQLPTK